MAAAAVVEPAAAKWGGKWLLPGWPERLHSLPSQAPLGMHSVISG